MKINDKKAIELFKEYLKSNMLREKIKIDDELYYSDYGITNNPFLMNNHTLYKTVNGKNIKVAEQKPKRISGGRYSEKIYKIVTYSEQKEVCIL